MEPLMDKRRTDPMYYPDLRQSNQEFNYYHRPEHPTGEVEQCDTEADQREETDQYNETDQHEETDHSEEADQFDEMTSTKKLITAAVHQLTTAVYQITAVHLMTTDNLTITEQRIFAEIETSVSADYHQSPNHHRSARSNRRADYPRYARAVDQQDSLIVVGSRKLTDVILDVELNMGRFRVPLFQEFQKLC
ncbi:hypothetical protein TYRP_021617, partial [Tyrophagus putrescentiae]